MLDIKLIRKNPEEIEAKLKTKVADADVKVVLALDTVIREKKTRVEQLKAKRNELSEQIARWKREGLKGPASLMAEVTASHDEIHSIDQELNGLEAAFTEALASLPNLPMDDIKVASDPKENVCVKSGEKPTFAFPFKVV